MSIGTPAAISAGTKLCPGCQTKKPLEQFYERRTRPNGRSLYCKECERKRARATQERYKAQPKPDLSGTTKTCPGCATEKPIDQFHKSNATLDGYHSYCKRCMYESHDKLRRANLPQFAEISRQWRAKNKERSKDHSLTKAYGVPVGTYAKMLAAQDGKCAICGRTDSGSKRARFHLDHDHETGAIAGLLCHGCNVSLGHYNHDVKILQAAIDYVIRTRGRKSSSEG
jgi:hypothetical protein